MIQEAAIALAVDALLEADGAEIFHEVSLEYQLRSRHVIGDGRADHVFIRDGARLGVVECKTTLSWELFAQAARWRDYTHETWIAVPFARMGEGRHEAFQIASKHYGFGVIEVDDGGAKIKRQAVLRDSIDPALMVSLRPEHKTAAAAGTNRGGQYTTFKETGAKLAAYVMEHPGAKLAEAVGAITHHYGSKASAQGAMLKMIKKGLVPGVHIGWRQGLYATKAMALHGHAPVEPEQGDEV